MTATSESRSTTIWPTLRYLDARAAIHFLVSTFGFVEKAVYGEGDVVDHAQLDWPGGGGIMGVAEDELTDADAEQQPRRAEDRVDPLSRSPVKQCAADRAKTLEGWVKTIARRRPIKSPR